MGPCLGTERPSEGQVPGGSVHAPSSAGGGRRGGPSWTVFVACSVALVLVASAATYLITSRQVAAALYGLPTTTAERETLRAVAGSKEFGDFLQTLTLIRTDYVDPPDMRQVLVGANRGALAALNDPYSTYFDAKEFANFGVDTSGEYGGIGVQISEQGDHVVVQTPFPGTPGATTKYESAGSEVAPGLRPGDVILQIDGRDVSQAGADAIASLIRGEPGTKVAGVVERQVDQQQPQQLTFHLTRAHITVPTVEWKMLPNRVGYLKISQFTEATPDAVRAALSALDDRQMRALVLDLRFNPGGRLDAVEEIAGLLVPRGPIVHVVDRSGTRQTANSDNPKGIQVPVVALVNGGSASGVAKLVGEVTFGKGLVQQVYDFRDGTGVKLTVARYLTPNGQDINKHLDPDTGKMVGGIAPDLQVTPPENWDPSTSMGKPEADPQLRAALNELDKEMAGQ